MRENDDLAKRPPYLIYILTALFLVIAVYVRIRLLTIPLERDEGEYAYIGQLLLKDIPPFSSAYSMKLPGVSVAYAFFMALFGQTPAGIHLGLLIVNVGSVYELYLLTKRLFDRNTALLSSASFALLSLSASVNGIFAHATNFVVLFALAGFLFLFRFVDNGRFSVLFLSGLCFGLAVTMKQHAFILLLFALAYFGWRVWKKPFLDRKLCMWGSLFFLIGAAMPYLLIIIWMVKTGNFAQFWFWTVQYANAYTATPSLGVGWDHFADYFGSISKFQLPFWVLAGAGVALLCFKRDWCTDRPFLFGFILFSFLSICPGLIFRGHYFVLLLPAVAIMAGACMCSAGHFVSASGLERFSLLIPALLMAGGGSYSLYRERDNFFTYTPAEVSRAIYGANPFPEAARIADYLREHTIPGEQIAVLGSEPEIYFYADRLSATGHIYMYGLMERQPYAERMQAQLIRQIEAARPRYVVVVNIAASWLLQKSSIPSILEWGERYLRNEYTLVGVVDIIDPVTTRYIWDERAAGYTPASETYVTVFKRNS